jgi:hypothetical protein
MKTVPQSTVIHLAGLKNVMTCVVIITAQSGIRLMVNGLVNSVMKKQILFQTSAHKIMLT